MIIHDITSAIKCDLFMATYSYYHWGVHWWSFRKPMVSHGGRGYHKWWNLP